MYQNPTDRAALSSLDFGSVYSLDGREHPVTATTPVVSVNASDPVAAASVIPTGFSIPGLSLPEHIGARVIVGIIAIALIIVVALRITL